jgi:hypothetical protein
METTIKTNSIGILRNGHKSVHTVHAAAVSWKNFWETMEFYRYGAGTALLVCMACITGGAAAVAVQDPGVIKLASVAVGASLLEAFVLGLTSMKMIVYSSIVLLVIDLLVIFS